ncbi:MAG: hypothetical protein IT299_06885 [Dehalococcoidia bacterium]|nr:hypothetical protein [Dehalococcoidia bacterium]
MATEVATRQRDAEPPASPRVTSTPVPHVDVSPFEIVRIPDIHGASPGGMARMTVQTAPALNCRVQYITPAGEINAPRGLEPKVTDDAGRASWAWLIDDNTPVGPGKVTATCSNGLSWHEYIIIYER